MIQCLPTMRLDSDGLIELGLLIVGAIFAALTGSLGFAMRREVRRIDSLAERVAKIDRQQSEMLTGSDLALFRSEFRQEMQSALATFRHDFGEFRVAICADRQDQIERIDGLLKHCAQMHSQLGASIPESVVREAARQAATEVLLRQQNHLGGA